MAFLSPAFLSKPAFAQANTSVQVAAEALFEEGRRLVADGKAAEACPKFADSERLDPSAGTLLNLANCYERLGRSATAWVTYREAVSLGASVGRQDLVTTAERHATALEPLLLRVTLTASAPIDGLSATLDGLPIGAASLGVPLPVDPGEHVAAATAPGHQSWSARFVVSPETKLTPISIPALEPLPAASSVAAPAPTAAPSPAAAAPTPPPAVSRAAPPAEAEPAPGGTQRTLGWIAGGAGVVGIALGTGFSVAAKSKYDDSLGKCDPDNHNSCSTAGVSERNSARSEGDVATVAMGVGIAALVGGVVLLLTAPSTARARAARIELLPTLTGAMVNGRW